MSEITAVELGLFDKQDRWLGTIRIEAIEPDWVLGVLAPTPAYAGVGHFFREFEEAVNEQLFTLADEVYENIEALGLQLRSTNGLPPIDIWNVQIMNVDKFCCKMSDADAGSLRKLLERIRQAS